MSNPLTSGAVAKLYKEDGAVDFQPWLQILDIKQIRPSSGNGADRYRVVLSDGQHYISGMLATQLAPLMVNKKIQKNYLVQLKDYIGNNVQGRRIIIVLGVDQIKPHEAVIGNAVAIDGTKVTNTTPATTAAPVKREVPPQAPPSAAPKPASMPRKPVSRDEPGLRLSDIDSLNPYPSGRWTIKARVTNRAPIKTWSNARGDGKLFSVELLDAKGGEIRATMFNDMVDQYYEMLAPGGTFYMSGGKVKMANRKFSSLNNNYEITFDKYSEIKVAPEDPSIAAVNFSFKKIAEIETLPAETNLDIIGVVSSVGDCTELTSKAGKQLMKRDLVMIDDSGAEVKVTMWNGNAKMDCDAWMGSVLAVKGCRVSDYNGKSLGTNNSSAFMVNPDVPEAGTLMHWYSAGGASSGTIKSLSSAGGFGGGGMGKFEERSTLADIKGKELGMGQKPDYITVSGMVNFIKHDKSISYQACTKCQKKVIQDVNQNYNCEKCQVTYESCENRYILSATLIDDTGNNWVSCFNDQGKILMGGKTADDMAELQMTNPPAFEKAFKTAQFKEFVFRLRIKAETMQEELRVKSSIVSLEALEYGSECENLLTAISAYN